MPFYLFVLPRRNAKTAKLKEEPSSRIRKEGVGTEEGSAGDGVGANGGSESFRVSRGNEAYWRNAIAPQTVVGPTYWQFSGHPAVTRQEGFPQ
jgi:hypothetical protein